jgi:dihydroflavonol-4-reductase
LIGVDGNRLMRILITGSTGLLGNNLVRLAIEQGHQVRVLIRTGSDPRPLSGLDVESFQGDVRDAEAVLAAAQTIDFIVHSAACVKIGWADEKLFWEVNVEGTRNVIGAAENTGARMIYVSSVNALGVGTWDRSANEDWVARPNIACPYVQTKQEAERLVLEHAQGTLDAVVVNPGFMLGPWDWRPSSGQMILQVAKRFTPFAPTGGCSICDVRDVAQAVLRAAEIAPCGRRYILGGENLSYFSLWKLIAEVTGGGRPWIPAGPLMRIIAGRFGDLRYRLTGKESDVNSAAVTMSNLPHFFSSQRAIDELAYRPRPPRESIQVAWQWFIEHGYVTAN